MNAKTKLTARVERLRDWLSTHFIDQLIGSLATCMSSAVQLAPRQLEKTTLQGSHRPFLSESQAVDREALYLPYMSWASLILSRIIFDEESDNMANLSGPYFLHGNAILFAFALLMWCCPTTQVTLNRDRGVVAVDDPLADGVRSDGHSSSSLVSRVGASIKPPSVVAYPQQQVHDRGSVSGGTHSSGNEVPDGVDNAKHVGSTKSPLAGGVRPSTRENLEKHWGGGSREGGGEERTGDALHSPVSGVVGSSSEGRGKGDEEASLRRPSETSGGGGGNEMDVIGDILEEESPEPTKRMLNDSPASGGGDEIEEVVNDVSKQTTCEKCKKQQDEDLLEEYDPNAMMQLRIESIKRRILDKLRMERPPQVNMSSVNIPAPLSEGTFIAEDAEDEDVRHHVHHVPSGADEEVYDSSEDYYGKTTRVIITTKAG